MTDTPCTTVGELRKALSEIPDSAEILVTVEIDGRLSGTTLSGMNYDPEPDPDRCGVTYVLLYAEAGKCS